MCHLVMSNKSIYIYTYIENNWIYQEFKMLFSPMDAIMSLLGFFVLNNEGRTLIRMVQ